MIWIRSPHNTSPSLPAFEVPKANPAVAPHLLARKYLKGTHEWVNIPSWIVEELIKHSRGAVIQSVEHLPVVQGACSIPKVVLQDCFDVIDTLQENADSERTLRRLRRDRPRFTSAVSHQDQWWLSCACALHLLATRDGSLGCILQLPLC